MNRSRARDAFERIRRWDVDEWLALARAAVLVARIEMGLRTNSIAVLADRLGITFDERSGPLTRPVARPPHFADDERRHLRALSRVLRYWPFGDTCLRQCLANGWVLRAHAPRLVIGVAREGSRLTVHSWLELVDGAIDPLASTHQPLARAVADPPDSQSTRRP